MATTNFDPNFIQTSYGVFVIGLDKLYGESCSAYWKKVNAHAEALKKEREEWAKTAKPVDALAVLLELAKAN